jgi:hypothetical protein
MTASVTHLRPRKPVRRPGAVPARRSLIEQTAATLIKGGYLPEDAAMFCPGNPDVASALEAAMTATELGRLAQTPAPF